MIAAAADEVNALSQQPNVLVHGAFVKDGQRLSAESYDGSTSSSNRDDRVCMLRCDRNKPFSTAALQRVDEAMESFGRDMFDALTDAAYDPEEGLGPLGVGPCGSILRCTGRSDMQIASYSGHGARYCPHIDNADGDGRSNDLGRVLSIVCYLTDMTSADGGALRLHLVPEAQESEPALADYTATSYSAAVDVVPRAGMVVAFRADRIVHEVRPCNGRERVALTVWLLAE